MESGNCCTDHLKGPRIRVLPKSYRCGIEIPVGDTLLGTLDSNWTQGSPCVQMYCTGKDIASAFTVKKFTPTDLEETKKYCLDKDVNFYIHCPFVANLAKDSCKRNQTVVQKELDIIKDLPGSCVLHVGKVGTITNVVNRINELNFRTGQHPRNRYPLLLECAAGQGTELGRTWEELRKLYEGLDKTKVGVCLDTQHLFASGMCNFENEESVTKMFDEAENILGRTVSLFHINDSLKIYESRVDRHECISKGYIWYKNQDSLLELVKRCNEQSIDMILETNNQIDDLKLMRSLTDKLKK